ncbi:MAG: hypothetical protein AAGH46_00075 [Bacteroidota bacterium]
MTSLFISFLMINTLMVQCSEIDKLKTSEEVEAFVKTYHKKIAESKAVLKIKSTEQLAVALNCNGLFDE